MVVNGASDVSSIADTTGITTAWGATRLGRFTNTTLNYTGQRLDGTGLLYYHARYYDSRYNNGRSTVDDSGIVDRRSSISNTRLG